MIRPQHLSKGGTIAIVSPARWLAADELNAGKRALERKGFSVFLHKQNYLRLHQFAGNDKKRCQAVESVFLNPKVKAIMTARGGYGAPRLLDALDYASIARHPKIIVGYSDMTALLLSIYVKTGLVTFHGPMLCNFTHGVDAQTWKWFEELVVEGKPIDAFFGKGSGVKVVRPGSAKGVILGGNLTLLANLIGTPSDFDTRGAILFLEDHDEYLYRLDRMLLHLKRSGKLSKLSAIAIGGVTKTHDNKIPFGLGMEKIVLELCSGTSFPIIAGFPFGHIKRQMTLPLGIMGELTAKKGYGVRFRTCTPAVD